MEWGEGRGGGYRWRPGRALVRQIPSHLGSLSRPSTAAVPAGCRHLPPSTVSSCLSFRATTDSEKTFVGPTGSREVCGESLHESVRRSIRREHLVARAHHVDERAHEAVRRPEHPPAHVHHFRRRSNALPPRGACSNNRFSSGSSSEKPRNRKGRFSLTSKRLRLHRHVRHRRRCQQFAPGDPCKRHSPSETRSF